MELILIAVLAFLVGSLATARVAAWLPRPRESEAGRVAELEARLQAVEQAWRTGRPVLPPPPPGRRW
ncbi:hypothetical protein AB0F15_43640 [Amycolatopsis sp. NPDC026612]|uniref:hypothetical protein n=1 Tax=Amycolatopsis sp. NPDC026612 TaxID=3155466 RepID=UPI0033EB477A